MERGGFRLIDGRTCPTRPERLLVGGLRSGLWTSPPRKLLNPAQTYFCPIQVTAPSLVERTSPPPNAKTPFRSPQRYAPEAPSLPATLSSPTFASCETDDGPHRHGFGANGPDPPIAGHEWTNVSDQCPRVNILTREVGRKRVAEQSLDD